MWRPLAFGLVGQQRQNPVDRHMSAKSAEVHPKGLSVQMSFGMLDESHFTQATTDAHTLRQASQSLPKNQTHD